MNQYALFFFVGCPKQILLHEQNKFKGKDVDQFSQSSFYWIPFTPFPSRKCPNLLS